ncbi:MAG: SMC-Scp complex subunit ScpB [Parachlamydiaceae bacterium]
MSKELNFFQNEINIQIVAGKPEDQPHVTSTCIQEHNAIPPADSLLEKLDSIDWNPINEQLHHHLKRVIEALLFATPDPLPLVKIREVTDTILPLRPRQLRHILDELRQEYIAQQRAFQLEEIAQGYVLRTYEEYAPYLDLLIKQKRWEKLSNASTEVLAIVAYRQPITRPQIDAIRGVDSSGSLMQLIERQLIESTGKLEAPGRPTLYGTTKEFLKHFGLKDISELKTTKTHH